MMIDRAITFFIGGGIAIACVFLTVFQTRNDGTFTLSKKRGVVFEFDTKTKSIQKHFFRNERGLLLNVHLTHHAGTTFCARFRKELPAPDFACMGIKEPELHNMTSDNAEEYRTSTKQKPWKYEDTGRNIQIVRKYFKFISQEFGARSVARNNYVTRISSTNWEHPKLVSVMIVRDPISRLLSGGGSINMDFGNEETRTHEQWWAYANQSYGQRQSHKTNNFNLHFLTNQTGCCQGKSTDPIHLEAAKALLQRFTYVLDQECLERGMQAMSKDLGFKLSPGRRKPPNRQESYRERIGYDDVYQFLMERNKLDIELYQWAKQITLVKCNN